MTGVKILLRDTFRFGPPENFLRVDTGDDFDFYVCEYYPRSQWKYIIIDYHPSPGTVIHPTNVIHETSGETGIYRKALRRLGYRIDEDNNQLYFNTPDFCTFVTFRYMMRPLSRDDLTVDEILACIDSNESLSIDRLKFLDGIYNPVRL